ncbi:hypothetical protein CJ179_01540 [Rhodococcus sp. ACS1]|uniref:DUF3263 domain-containing protein n=1 Tax=Rhodococcus jostii TaxID=132919 RepID=A0A1H4IL93_RHOJO|nr:hypothetical protein [Rhodococcus jostii]PBC52109.1 hypothetical protein CJ179_01540 [Rhodococcus sp. ACS1]SEB34693.1 hypothetical protein SAMN04490220_0178 [Rhodococcus jostii]
MNCHEYRRRRQRRRAASIDVDRKHRSPEAELLIAFASKWAPYGGATEAEIFVHFGMTSHRFIDRLWQVVPESDCTREELRSLASAYPHYGRTSGAQPVP